MKKHVVMSLLASGVAVIGLMGATTQAFAAGTSTPSSVSYGFTQAGDQPDKMLETAIGKARSTLDIAIYSINHYYIVDAIRDAKKRGVKVRIITDASEAQNSSQANELSYLSKFNIPIIENTHSGIMHMKRSIIDGKTVCVGSFNYTHAASTENDEVLLIIQDPKMAKDFTREFNTMWTDGSRFASWQG